MKPRILLSVLFLPALAAAQDSTRTPTSSLAPKDTLERVVIRATRAGTATPTSQTYLTRERIERTYVGQDAPLALQGATGITAHSDAGTFSGYSSIRLRGIDQTRLTISVDGVPLNDPEDQVLYFSNVPDFMNSMQSVRVQRGVGSSGFGTASYAGAIDFESLPIAATPRFAEAQVTAGSWGTQRVSIEGATGLTGRFAAYARVSGQETDGYREHSGNWARSMFASAGWFGVNDALKFTGFAGRSKMQLSYYAGDEPAVQADPRVNPMSPLERDDFWQAMASLQYTRVLAPGATLTTTAYRNAAGGNYDVLVAPDVWNFNLDHTWYGVLSAVAVERGRMRFAGGLHASTYARDHFLYVRPDLATRQYDNTGHKQEQSAFAKVTYTVGRLDLLADLQLRRTLFRYEPSAGNTIGEPEIAHTFANPKVGFDFRASDALSFHASLGMNRREPTRSDMLAGADDLNDGNAADLLPLDRVRPERVVDLEGGLRLTRGTFALGLNGFHMSFHDEIAPIGAVSLTGSQLRRNVDRSTRTGIEAELDWRPSSRFAFSGNTTVMKARIAEYTDEASGTTYRDVPPLLTPALMINGQATWRPLKPAELTLSWRHVDDVYLANDGNEALQLPWYNVFDLGSSVSVGRHTVRVAVQNLLDQEHIYTSGYTDGSLRYPFPLAGRTLMATLSLRF